VIKKAQIRINYRAWILARNLYQKCTPEGGRDSEGIFCHGDFVTWLS